MLYWYPWISHELFILSGMVFSRKRSCQLTYPTTYLTGLLATSLAGVIQPSYGAYSQRLRLQTPA